MALGIFIAAFGYFNDWIMNQAYVAGDLIPVSVYGLLVLGVLVLNPLMRLAGRRHFKASEWCVIASLMLAACVIPGPGLMWNFSNTLIMPHHAAEEFQGWQAELLDYVPEVMLADVSQNREKVLKGFMEGLGRRREFVNPAQVPWDAWTKTLSFWLLLLALSFVAGICLVLVVHHQWAHRERLRYPVADFASQLVRGAGDHALPGIFRSRRFWIGFSIAAGVLLMNGYANWNNKFITIPMGVDLSPLGKIWPVLWRSWPARALLTPTFYFAAIGFAYFLSLEVSFSLGISHAVFAVVFVMLSTSTSLDFKGDYLAGGLRNFALFGAYLGVAIMIFYSGRRLYLAVLSRALFVPGGRHAERSAVWACRIALLAALGMVLLLVAAVRLNWMLAVLYVLLTGLMFLVMTRINCETGLFFIQPTWHAVGVLLGLFGAAALGGNMLIILGLLSVAMTIDPRVCLMPLAANALRFSESEGVRPGRLSVWLAAAVVLALVIGVPATLYIQYGHGGASYGWANTAANYPFRMLQRNLEDIRAGPETWQGFDLSEIRLDEEFLWPVAVGAALAVGCSWLRLKFTWWPLHPVIFLVWGTLSTACFAASFFLGWLIKFLICKFGGSKSYERNKPFFVGLVAGEFIAGIFWMIVGLAYYALHGYPGRMFRVHP
jgi:hypothetical protein